MVSIVSWATIVLSSINSGLEVGVEKHSGERGLHTGGLVGVFFASGLLRFSRYSLPAAVLFTLGVVQ